MMQTYLNDYVKELIDSITDPSSDNNINLENTWSESFLLNFNYIADKCIKSSNTIFFDYHQSSIYLSKCINMICTNIINNKQHNFDDLQYVNKFIANNNEFEILKFYYNRLLTNRANQEIENYECLLYLFVIIERNLRVLSTQLNGKKQTNEFLLSDLILNKSFESYLTKSFVDVLKCLIGSPRSLNIRNLVWHGFLELRECSKFYSIFLILILNYIGFKVSSLNMKNASIGFKSLISYDVKSNENFLNEMNEKIPELIGKIEQSDLIPETRRDLWKYIVKLNVNDKYYLKSILLALPQIEFLLRLAYINVNGLDAKHNLCAQDKHFYLTMNELLSEFVLIQTEQQPNKLVDRLGNSCMLIFYDLFMYEDGARIRDRLSHGEYELKNSENWKIYSDLCLYLVYMLCSRSQCTYNCVYHPLMRIKYELATVLESVPNGLFVNLNKSFQNQLLNLQDGFECSILSKDELSGVLANFHFNVLYLYSEEKDSQTCLSLRYVNQLRSLIKKCESVLLGLFEFEATRSAKYELKQLHSRNRVNYEKFQNSFDLYKQTTVNLMAICVYVYLSIGLKKYEILQNEKFFKLLRKLFIYFDKLSQLIKQNRWADCDDLILKEFNLKINECFLI